MNQNAIWRNIINELSQEYLEFLLKFKKILELHIKKCKKKVSKVSKGTKKVRAIPKLRLAWALKS